MNLTRRLTLLDETVWHRLASVRRFAVANKGLMAYLVAVAVVAFGYDLASFSLKTDAELHAVFAGAKLGWIEQGRWAMYYLNAGLMPDSVMPFMPTLIGILGLACGVLFFVRSLSDQSTVADYLAAPLVIACPILAFGFYFTTLNYGLGVAIAAIGAGHYALTRWRWSGAALASGLFAFAIGIYQAALLLIPVLFGFYLVAQAISVPHLDGKLLFRRFCVFCAVALAACGIYESMKLVTLHAYDVPYAQEYMGGYVNWRADPAYWSATLRKTLDAARAYYTGSEDYYLYKLRIVAVLFWTVLVLTVLRLLVTQQSASVKIIGVLALAGSLCAPLVMHLVNGGQMPPRAMLGVPFVLGGLVFCTTVHGNRTVNLALGMLVLACFFNFAVANNRYALANELTWKADQDLSLLILQRVQSQWHKLPDRGPHPVMLAGVLEAHESPLYVRRDLIGSSFYNLNGGNVGRVVGLWRSMRHFEFREASSQEAIGIASRTIDMPIWPSDGSVDVVDGVIVVKIGEFTAQQIITLCNHAPTHDFCEWDAQRLLALAPSVNGTPPIYQGRWSSAPAGSEEAWGLELAHQRDTVFVSWFTYDLAGRDWWLTMSAQRQKPKVYAGTLIETRGPSFASAFKPSDLRATPVGSGTLTFSDANNAILDYTVKGIQGSMPISRTMLGDLSPCSLGVVPKASTIPNYRGLWWAAPAGSESGWGLSLNQRGDTILGTWFTYDLDGAPLWLSMNAAKTGQATYSGELHRRAGGRFDALDPAALRSTKVGIATLDFRSEDNATFSFAIDGVGTARVERTKTITRAVAGSPGIRCQWPSAVGSGSGRIAESTEIRAPQ